MFFRQKDGYVYLEMSKHGEEIPIDPRDYMNLLQTLIIAIRLHGDRDERSLARMISMILETK